jgi:hypothetical protein
MGAVDELVLEVAPGELKRVAECTDDEILSAALLLLISEAPDESWDEQFAVVRVVAAHKLLPTAAARAREGVQPLGRALARLPWEARKKVAVELRKCIDYVKAGG